MLYSSLVWIWLLIFMGGDSVVHTIILPIRDVVQSNDPSIFDTEDDWQLVEFELPVDSNSVALVLIDVWAYHPNDGIELRMADVTISKIVPLVSAWRQAGLPIIHVAHNREIHPLVVPRDGEVVITNGSYDQFFKFIADTDIDTLVYAGHASNMCIPYRAVGIEASSRMVSDVVFVRDASIAIGGVHDPQVVHDMAVYQIELMWGSSTTTEGVINAIGNIPG